MKHLFSYLVIFFALACSSLSHGQENESAAVEAEQDPTHELLKSKNFSEALARIESTEHSDSAKLMYWKAVCFASEKRYDEANQVLDAVIARWPETRYGKDGLRLKDCLKDTEAKGTETVAILKSALADVRSNHSLIELDIRTLAKQQQHFIVGFDFAKNQWQMQALTDGDLVFSIASTEKECRWFTPQMENIYQFSSTFFPWIDVDIQKETNGAFKFKINGGITSEAKSTKAPLKSMLESKWLSTDDGIHDLFIECDRKSGGFPAAVQKDKNAMTCTWLSPNLETAGFYETKYKFIDGRLAEIACPDYEILVSYSAKELDKLKDLKWPDVETKKMTMESGFIQDFANLLSQLAQPSPPGSIH